VIKLLKPKTEIKTFYENEWIEENNLIEDIINIADQIPNYKEYFSISHKKNGIKFTHYVGILKTKNYTMQVLPKIWENEKRNEDSINFVKLLLYAFLDPKTRISDVLLSVEKNDMDIYELLIRLFSISLENEISLGVYRDYKKEYETSRYLRGRLDIREHINKIDKSKFKITDFYFTSDNSLNEFFLYASNLFEKISTDDENKQLLSFIIGILKSENITNKRIVQGINFNRMNERFHIPYNYAKIILDNLIPMPGNGDKFFMMLFDMNDVFEKFFERFIFRNQEIIFEGYKNIDLKFQEPKKNFIYENNINPIRRTIPDVFISLKDSIDRKYIIFDTKYKIINNLKINENENTSNEDIYEISNNDLYQMFTYSELYKSNAAVLVFPGKRNSESTLSDKYTFKKNGSSLFIYRINMDLDKNQWENDNANDLKNYIRIILSN